MKTTRGRAMRRSAAKTTTPVARSANALLISKARRMTTLRPRTKNGATTTIGAKKWQRTNRR
ncbi:hypothetical protein JG688_00013339 [Phytophthora aleatoria]|uniref:Uncharacterized protein n=1 Tax=Phytophthora aleatoria TaxID=2496075 RepID=A0A8J5M429_9STRA|nr:hypothetical protein JG688_00013339 [Phytophthora aleatoria]